jgi:glycosyltransferase involved in cell wall biosynthesis
LLFDMRGFWAEERVDGGMIRRNGAVHRTLQIIERVIYRNADCIVTLTKASVPIIQTQKRKARAPIYVIPTCADLDRFRPQPELSPQKFTLGYLGSAGTWYLFDEVLEVYKLIVKRVPDARMLVVNRHEHDFIRTRIIACGVDPARIEIIAADHRSVPAMIARMTVGTAIIKPVHSKVCSAPTKLAEYLGCGVPCLGNAGVGDVVDVLESERTGVTLTDFSPADRTATIDRLFNLLADAELAVRCRNAAKRLFSLDMGVAAYGRIYRELLM